MGIVERHRLGDVWRSPRGKLYTIVGWDAERAIIRDEGGVEDGAICSLMVPQNGWICIVRGKKVVDVGPN